MADSFQWAVISFNRPQNVRPALQSMSRVLRKHVLFYVPDSDRASYEKAGATLAEPLRTKDISFTARGNRALADARQRGVPLL